MNSSTPEYPILLKASEAAKRLNVSYPTLKKWIKCGKILSHLTEGGHHRIPITEIERLSTINQSWVLDEEISVLIVEDLLDTQEVLKLILEKKGFHVEIADNFEKAILNLSKHTPDIIVTDLYSGREETLSGIQLIRHVRSKSFWADIPIIVLSGYTAPSILHEAEALEAGATTSATTHIAGHTNPYKAEALEAGATLVLDKPEGFFQLADAIHQLLCDD